MAIGKPTVPHSSASAFALTRPQAKLISHETPAPVAPQAVGKQMLGEAGAGGSRCWGKQVLGEAG
ncbi:hypothetical protein, partial [Kribbella solani]|uniref:hypothetical protein n=1 Tax=Kribbella solani TaxID=236067 RepID=UPI0029A6847A